MKIELEVLSAPSRILNILIPGFTKDYSANLLETFPNVSERFADRLAGIIPAPVFCIEIP